jgi:leucyl aminopeptidase (aminopeptidase T)
LNDEILRVVADQDSAIILREASFLAPRLSAARKIEIITDGGYERPYRYRLIVDIDPGFARALINEPAIRPGFWSNVPNGMVSVLPTNASGSVLIVGSAPGVVLNSHEPAILTFEFGRLVSVEGQEPFRSLFNQMLEAARAGGDTNWNAIAELSIGVNPGVSVFSGNSLVDSKARGALTVGIGDNTARGGRIRSMVRIDFVTLRATVSIDSVEVLHSGQPTPKLT